MTLQAILRAAHGLILGFFALAITNLAYAGASRVNQSIVNQSIDCQGHQPSRRALLIGAQEYANLGSPPLLGPVNDTQLLARALEARGFQTTVLGGADATEANADKLWEATTQGARCDDHITLALSGRTTFGPEAIRWGFFFEDAELNGQVPKHAWFDTKIHARVAALRERGVHVTLILDIVGVQSASLFPPPNACCGAPLSPPTQPAGSLTLLAAPLIATERVFSDNGSKRSFGTFSYLLSKLIASTDTPTVQEIQSRLHEIFRTEEPKCSSWESCVPYTAATHPNLPFLHSGPMPLPAPSAKILLDSTGGQISRGAVRVEGTQVTGQVQPTDGLLWLELAGKRVEKLPADGRFSVQLPLRRGDNDIDAAAFYANRPQFVTRLTIHSTGGQWQTERPANSYALLIANEQYDLSASGFGPLNTPRADADRLAQELTQHYGFRTSLPRSDGSQRSLILHNANRAEIYRALDDLARIATPADAVLIFYAGHGTQLKSEQINGTVYSRTYWVPTDSRKEDGDAPWVSAQDIDAKIARIRARHVLLVSDSCYAGGLNRGGDTGLSVQTADADRFLSEMSRKPSRYLLASGGNHPVDDGQGNSPFVQALLDVLRQPPAPAFTLQQVFPELQKRVSNSTRQTPEFPPLRGDAGVAGDGGAMVFFSDNRK